MRPPFLALLAISLISGCSSKSEQTGGQLSDAELLKLNQQCRDAADRYAAAESGPNVADSVQTVTLDSVKYSQTHRRCLARYSRWLTAQGSLAAASNILADPVSKDIFASDLRTPQTRITFIDATMKGKDIGTPNFGATEQEFLQFARDRLREP